MENGGLYDKFAGLTVNDANNSQVLKAVEAAEATIKQQVEENIRLRAELHRKHEQLENYKSDRTLAQRNHSVDSFDEHDQEGLNSHRRGPEINSQDTFLHHDSAQNFEEQAGPYHNRIHSGLSKTNGNTNILPQRQTNADLPATSQLSSLSTPSFSSGRYPAEIGYDSSMNVTRQGLMPIPEANSSDDFQKQDIFQKTRAQEQEIMHLRKRLTEHSIKETQIFNEKYVLEKRIAAMRMAFDQQQQDLVDAASKALSYRQEIIEENVRLTYALQEAQQERTTFVSSLLPLLAEFSLQPPVPDAQSIVSSVKVLFKHLQEKLIVTESKLKDSQYQSTPWRGDGSSPNLAPQSPQIFSGPGLTSGNSGLELVPQFSYPSPNVATSDGHLATDWDFERQQAQQMGLSSPVARSVDYDGMGKHSSSALSFRNPPVQDTSSQGTIAQDDVHGQYYSEETMNRPVKFKEQLSTSDMDESDAEGVYNEGERPTNWSTGSHLYTNTADEPGTSYSPHLQPVLEEPSSSFSEAADDDPLPGIQGLQISGEPFPGHELQACGYSINGTTSCNFEWVRHLNDGSVNYIDGAKQPVYLVTADDVETFLAIEVQPLDERKRKGELVRVFANDQRKIALDDVMHDHLEKNLYNGQASYKVSLSTGYLDIWEPATLIIKREGYSIKCGGPSGVVVTEKFSPATVVTIMYGHASEFSIITASGEVQVLRAESPAPDVSSLRDVIVLTLRLFTRKQAGDRRKGKKRRSLFFNK